MQLFSNILPGLKKCSSVAFQSLRLKQSVQVICLLLVFLSSVKVSAKVDPFGRNPFNVENRTLDFSKKRDSENGKGAGQKNGCGQGKGNYNRADCDKRKNKGESESGGFEGQVPIDGFWFILIAATGTVVLYSIKKKAVVIESSHS